MLNLVVLTSNMWALTNIWAVPIALTIKRYAMTSEEAQIKSKLLESVSSITIESCLYEALEMLIPQAYVDDLYLVYISDFMDARARPLFRSSYFLMGELRQRETTFYRACDTDDGPTGLVVRPKRAKKMPAWTNDFELDV
ncbi:uncharacterized protein G2W53_020011 [Senna tora]|uniref:Uncharacterized protein n=1 Tax=Senna tora TaxID=362788 RepID=A0A834WMZ2_9FABA|nr:uncharacterized protein G2W53_020011 [Senna tora]